MLEGRARLWNLTGAFATVAVALLATVAIAQEPLRYGVDSIAGRLNESRARLTKVNVDDGTCRQAFHLSETDTAGEHIIYGAARLSSDVRLNIVARARNRYGIQIGFIGRDWASYAIAEVNLISGAYTVIQQGHLQANDVVVRDGPASWKKIELRSSDQRAVTPESPIMGFALIKLTADGSVKSYPGKAGHGVELCADPI